MKHENKYQHWNHAVVIRITINWALRIDTVSNRLQNSGHSNQTLEILLQKTIEKKNPFSYNAAAILGMFDHRNLYAAP